MGIFWFRRDIVDMSYLLDGSTTATELLKARAMMKKGEAVSVRKKQNARLAN
jgi:hypothetical protein